MTLKLEFLTALSMASYSPTPSSRHQSRSDATSRPAILSCPPTWAPVSQHHLTIQHIDGRYRLAIYGDNPVLIDEREAVDGAPLSGSQILTLVTTARACSVGPLQLHLAARRPHCAEPPLLPPSAVAPRAFRGFAILLVALAMGIGSILTSHARDRVQIAALADQLAELQRTTVSPKVLNDVSASVYLVFDRQFRGPGNACRNRLGFRRKPSCYQCPCGRSLQRVGTWQASDCPRHQSTVRGH